MPGFGFARYPQQPTPNAQAVGQALMQQGQQQPAPQPMAPPMMGGSPDQINTGHALEAAALRKQGATQMGGPGQMADGPDEGDEHSINSLNIAVGEALTRMGSGYTTNLNPHKNRAGNMRQLQQLGLSAAEARLLAESGGI